MTIAQRVSLYRLAAKSGHTAQLRRMYAETADVLEATAAVYNELCKAALETLRNSNGLDPALDTLRATLAAHGQQLPPTASHTKN